MMNDKRHLWLLKYLHYNSRTTLGSGCVLTVSVTPQTSVCLCLVQAGLSVGCTVFIGNVLPQRWFQFKRIDLKGCAIMIITDNRPAHRKRCCCLGNLRSRSQAALQYVFYFPASLRCLYCWCWSECGSRFCF